MAELARRRSWMFRGASFGSAVTSVLLLVLAPTPAIASRSTYGDATADAPSSIDITSVPVELTNREVRLKLRIADLESEQGAWRV